MRAYKKNISKILHDVKPPVTFEPQNKMASLAVEKNYENFTKPVKHIEVHLVGEKVESVKLRPKDSTDFLSGLTKYDRISNSALIKKRNNRSKLKTVFAMTLCLAVILYGLSLYSLRDNARGSINTITSNLSSAIVAFKSFKNEEAGVALKNAGLGLDSLGSQLNKRGLLGLSALLGTIFPVAENAKLTFDNSKIALTSAIALNEDIAKLKEFGIVYFMNGEGDKFAEILKTMQGDLKQVISSGETLQKLNSSISNSFISNYVNLPDTGNNISSFKEGYAADEFLTALIKTIGSDTPSNLLLLFQNSSEMRPSGGFLGSYASLTLSKGALQSFDVRDIYDPDGWINKKIIPPKPLQIMITDWEARDANWFLDYRLSAEKVIGRLEDSLIYKEKNTTFIGAIAVNTNVIVDLIGLAGPIELSQYKLTITKENFLDKVQYEVEAGTNKAKNQPKKILADMTPILLSRLSALNSGDKNKLFELLRARIVSKDIQIYFKDKSLEQFMEKYEMAGAVFDAPDNWSGDYLAVVNANVAGGKTDAYIEQHIIASSTFDMTGKATNSVIIKRDHSGGKTAYRWYNVTNKDYIRLLTSPEAKLINITNDTPRTINAPINFIAKGYVVDPDIALLEGSGIESGKNVFSAWRFTNPQSSSTISFSYERLSAIAPKSGITYQLVFDKQSGVKTGIQYIVEAPPGFRWKEAKNSIFN
ncbi:MAG: DUF4012 domain-containing protein, partial [bacterium]|nr:DUF4012 domain-containing protein [bacterium]